MSRRSKLPPGLATAAIESFDLRRGGIARVDGLTVYLMDALPGEEVTFSYTRARRKHAEGRVEQVISPSPERVVAGCDSFGHCGGCTLQHWDRSAQLRAKQHVLLNAFQEIGGVVPDQLLVPLAGPSGWGYRSKARLGVKFVAKKDRVLVGFRERGSGFICETERCAVLDPRVGDLLEPLAEMLGTLSVRDQLPQIEVAAGDTQCALVFRVLESPAPSDRDTIAAFCQKHRLIPFLQTAGPESMHPLVETRHELSYCLPNHDVVVGFLPGDFTQVNRELNRLMVDQALEMLDLQPEDRVLELFCGLGNFTLPIARRAAEVVGVDGDPGLIARAKSNARANSIHNIRYCCADLYQIPVSEEWILGCFNKIVLDPPRSGASEVLEPLSRIGAERILYISCCPETLARDSGLLVRKLGYRLVSAGVMDMFPHTAHVESIALFQKGG